MVCDLGFPLPSLCDTAEVVITVSNDPLPPVAVNDNESTDENTPVNIDLLNNDSDPQGDSINVTYTFGGPNNGSVYVDPLTGVATYTPDPVFNGVDTFNYIICNTSLLCDTATVYITINPVNNPPEVEDEYIVTPINEDTTICLTISDSDLLTGEDSLTCSIYGMPLNGSATLDANNCIEYIPNTDWTGVDTIQKIVCDLAGECDTATIIVNVIDCDLSDPALDCDGDGVPNGTEDTDGTNPLDPCDFVFANQTLPPSAAWNDLDCDNDGVDNGPEVNDPTDPTNPCDYPGNLSVDSDNDGYTDCEEITGNDDPDTPNDPNGVTSDPNCDQSTPVNPTGVCTNCDLADANSDCDGDGVPNGTEDGDGTDPSDPCDFIFANQTLPPSTAWDSLDCDNDGVNNGPEINDTIQPTDPLNPCDYPGNLSVDTDGDQYTDCEEITGNDDPNTTNDPNGSTSDPNCDQSTPVNPQGECEKPPVYIPEVFSPNGDGDNDYVVIPGIENYPGNTLLVFNRWGNKVFEGGPYNNDWGGIPNVNVIGEAGVLLPSGTYFYVLDLGDGSDKLSGYIYLYK